MVKNWSYAQIKDSNSWMISFQCVFFHIKTNEKQIMPMLNLKQYMKYFAGLYAFKTESRSTPYTANKLEMT